MRNSLLNLTFANMAREQSLVVVVVVVLGWGLSALQS
jgi:hypothetical protein